MLWQRVAGLVLAVLALIAAALHTQKANVRVRDTHSSSSTAELGPPQSTAAAAAWQKALAGLSPGASVQNHSKVVVLPDIHGDLQQTKDALVLSGLLSKAGEWVGGDALLVQLGDVLDRGKDSLALLRFFSNLEVS